MDAQKTFRNLPEMSIVGGPGMRELELALTDPRPTGALRITKFDYVQPDKHIVCFNSRNIFALERGKRDPQGDRYDAYFWKIAGETTIYLRVPGDEPRVRFEITSYSTTTREGKVRFFEPDTAE